MISKELKERMKKLGWEEYDMKREVIERRLNIAFERGAIFAENITDYLASIYCELKEKNLI